MKWLPALVSLLVVSACADRTPNNAEQLDAPAALQGLLDGGVAEGIPGLSAAVATSDGLVWTGVAGSADLETGVPVSPDMLFGIGSITKTFVAVVILQLVEEGLLDLNATSAGLLGSAVDGIPNADEATVAQLLNHTGGVPSWEDDPVWISDGRGATLDVSRIWGKNRNDALHRRARAARRGRRGVQLRQHELHAARNDHREGDRLGSGRRDPPAHPRPAGSRGHPSRGLRTRAGGAASAPLPLGDADLSR